MANKTNNKKNTKHVNNKRCSSKEKSVQDYLEEKKNLRSDIILNFNSTQHIEGLLSELEYFIKEKWNVITTSQLRNIYDKVKRTKEYSELHKIRPQLAYVAARQNNKSAKELVVFLKNIIVEVKNNEQLESFQNFFEAIVGYHKYYINK